MKTEFTREQLAAMIDHTNLKADVSEKDMIRLCQEARALGCAMVAVNSAQVSLCARLLKGSLVHVGAAVSFPLGQTPLSVKLFETRKAMEDGADEIDYVVNLTQVKDGRWDLVEQEMKEIASLCASKGVICKAIFENCCLSRDEIRHLAQIAPETGIDFIKTSTGFGTGGATVEDVRLMKETVGDAVQIKAAGGIRSLEEMLTMIEAGATRIGTSAAKAILEEYDAAADR